MPRPVAATGYGVPLAATSSVSWSAGSEIAITFCPLYVRVPSFFSLCEAVPVNASFRSASIERNCANALSGGFDVEPLSQRSCSRIAAPSPAKSFQNAEFARM